MSHGLSLVLIAGGLVAVVAVWILATRRSRGSGVAPRAREPEPIVAWMRPRDHRIAHAFRTAELRAQAPDVQALAFCGQWPVATLVPVNELVSDDDAPRCVPCDRALEAMRDRE